jgi:serine carboxypeptidase-like clade 2
MFFFPLFLQLGNPLIDDYHDNVGTHEFWWNHGLISDSTYKDLKKFCPNSTFLFPKSECNSALKRAYSEFGDINPYSIYSSPCNEIITLRHYLNYSLVYYILGSLKIPLLFLIPHFPLINGGTCDNNLVVLTSW